MTENSTLRAKLAAEKWSWEGKLIFCMSISMILQWWGKLRVYAWKWCLTRKSVMYWLIGSSGSAATIHLKKVVYQLYLYYRTRDESFFSFSFSLMKWSSDQRFWHLHFIKKNNNNNNFIVLIGGRWDTWHRLLC